MCINVRLISLLDSLTDIFSEGLRDIIMCCFHDFVNNSQWIIIEGKPYSKPSILPSNMGFSCRFSNQRLSLMNSSAAGLCQRSGLGGRRGVVRDSAGEGLGPEQRNLWKALRSCRPAGLKAGDPLEIPKDG